METGHGPAEFLTTRWTLFHDLRDSDASRALAALDELCQTYWAPLYAYVRRKGHTIEDAKDLTQGFFATLVEKGSLEQADPQRGRFRAFILTALKNYLVNQHKFRQAKKRGGDRTKQALDTQWVESDLRVASRAGTTPEETFRRAWGMTVIEQAFGRFEAQLREAGKGEHFEQVRAFLQPDGDRPSYKELAARLGLSESQVTNLLHRYRKQLRQQIRETIRETVSSEPEVDEELRELFDAVG